MDKRTIQIVLVCMLALLGVTQIVNHIYPPIPRKIRPVALTNVAPAVVTNVVEQIKPAPVVERGDEQVVALSNNFVRVEFTSLGGGIKSVTLLQHKANGHGHAVLNGPALVLEGSREATFVLEPKDATTIVMRGAGVTKTVSLGADYLLQGNIEFTGGSTNMLISAGIAAPMTPKEAPQYLLADWQGGPKWADRNLGKIIKRTRTGENTERIQAHWIAVKNQYFVQVLSAATNAVSITYAPVARPVWPEQLKSAATNGVTAMMEVPVTRGADGRAACAFTFYAGPKDYDRLLALGQNQEEAMDYGSWMDFYSGIFGLVLLRSLNFFHDHVIASYGMAILLVTLTLKIIFWPIQAKSMASMKQMQKFQPQLAKLKEKYKDDAARLNQETMKLYKEHKINPFAGCLPMFVQLPVLMAFYKVLVSDIALRGASFLWIKDLGLPDTVAMVAGFAINPLPIVMAGSMVWQQKLTPQTGDPQQAKMMMFMPLIMLMFFYNTASGLTLYWTLQQLLSIFQQWWGLRKDKTAGIIPVTGKTK